MRECALCSGGGSRRPHPPPPSRCHLLAAPQLGSSDAAASPWTVEAAASWSPRHCSRPQGGWASRSAKTPGPGSAGSSASRWYVPGGGVAGVSVAGARKEGKDLGSRGGRLDERRCGKCNFPICLSVCTNTGEFKAGAP